MDEKRHFERTKVGQNVVVKSELGMPINCTLVDISRSGARISCDTPKMIPEQFVLIIKDGLQRRCKTVMRSGKNIGVVFIARAG